MRNELLKITTQSSVRVVRVLQGKGNKVLIIDCLKIVMPGWVPEDELSDYTPCPEEELYALSGFDADRILTPEEMRIARERYTLIAGLLPFVGDEAMRSEVLELLATDVSKQTIRKYLCLYLVYQTVEALAPKAKSERELTEDEKNFRWGLNKFYYSRHRNSLHTAYVMMLKERYCDAEGVLVDGYPSFDKFRYFYRKTKSLRKYYISRDGIKSYQRNNRPLLGDGVQEFCPCVGYGMLDSTICDIFLVDDGGKLIGRPILTACVDGFSGFCCGYSLGWEGGTYSLRSLMLNVVSKKVEWCRERGVFIEPHQWDCSSLPATLVTDMGSEYAGETFSQITELGVKIVNLSPYRPELKGRVEKFFDLIQSSYKQQLKGKGVIEPDYQERGVHDYRKDACLTLRQFEQIILHCIIYYNNSRVIDFPFTSEMLSDGVRPHAADVFAFGKKQAGANMIDVPAEKLILTLLPRATGRFTRKGLQVNGLRYRHEAYSESYLKGGEAVVAYNPDDVTQVWLFENYNFTPFNLIESRFKGKTVDEAKALQRAGKQLMRSSEEESLQAEIDLADHIRVIASQSPHKGATQIKDIRSTRKREQKAKHEDLVNRK